MCNFYLQTKSQDAMRHAYEGMVEEGETFEDLTGKLPPSPAIFPDYIVPIILRGARGYQLSIARWGKPTPQTFLEGNRMDAGVTNIRNTSSPHWHHWFGVEHRCLSPAFARSTAVRAHSAIILSGLPLEMIDC